MKNTWQYLIIAYLTFSCIKAQRVNYANTFQSTTLDENTKWLQNKLNFTRKSIVNEQIIIQTEAQYDSINYILPLYYKDLTDTSSMNGVRFLLAKLRPENIIIDEVYTPSINKKEYLIFIDVAEVQHAVQAIKTVNGQQEIKTSFIPQGISLPDHINQNKTAVEEIAGRM